MKKKETICQEAHRLLKDIPENKWITGDYSNENHKCCAVGHYQRLKSKNTNDFDIFTPGINGRKLISATSNFCKKIGVRRMLGDQKSDIIDINDGYSIHVGNKRSNSKYDAMTPKQRVLLFLKDCIQAGY